MCDDSEIYYDVPIFGGGLWVFYDKESFVNAYSDSTGDTTRPPIDRLGGVVYSLDNNSGGSSIRLVGIFEHKPSVVCHEAVHCAWAIVKDAGVNDEETLAHVTGWCFSRIMENLPTYDETSNNLPESNNGTE